MQINYYKVSVCVDVILFICFSIVILITATPRYQSHPTSLKKVYIKCSYTMEYMRTWNSRQMSCEYYLTDNQEKIVMLNIFT
jgi:hypothetical protein